MCQAVEIRVHQKNANVPVKYQREEVQNKYYTNWIQEVHGILKEW